MEEIRYSENFYVNEFPDKDEQYAKRHIEAFMKKAPKNLFDYLESQNNFGQNMPEFQAVIIGEPKISMFGKSQVAVVMIHSTFIAYTTASDYNSPINRTYGYATFDNQISIEKTFDHLEMHFAYERLALGVGTESLEKDFDFVSQLLADNYQAVQDYFEQPDQSEPEEHIPADESTSTLDEASEEVILFPVPSDEMETLEEADDSDEVIIEEHDEDVESEVDEIFVVDESIEEEPIELETEMYEDEDAALEEADLELSVNQEEMVTDDMPFEEEEIPMRENENDKIDDQEDLPIDDNILDEAAFESEEETYRRNASYYDVEDDAYYDDYVHEHEDFQEDVEREHLNFDSKEEDETILDEPDLEAEEDYHFVPFDERNRPARPNTLDARFNGETMVISNNTIPRGFVFARPVVYASSLRPGIFKSTTPKEGYLNAYNKCLDNIRQDIREGKFDAVFNLQFSAQSVENYYEVILTGDAVIYAEDE